MQSKLHTSVDRGLRRELDAQRKSVGSEVRENLGSGQRIACQPMLCISRIKLGIQLRKKDLQVI